MNTLVLIVDDERSGRTIVVVALAVNNVCLSATETAVASSSFSAIAALGECERRPGPARGEKADPFSTQSARLP